MFIIRLFEAIIGVNKVIDVVCPENPLILIIFFLFFFIENKFVAHEVQFKSFSLLSVFPD